MVVLGTVRFHLKDLISHWPTDSGVRGLRHVEGYFIALMLKDAPDTVRAGFDTEKQRNAALAKLDKLKRVKPF